MRIRDKSLINGKPYQPAILIHYIVFTLSLHLCPDLYAEDEKPVVTIENFQITNSNDDKNEESESTEESNEKNDDEADKQSLPGAQPETDPEIDLLISQAKEFAENKQYSTAATLIDKAMQSSNHVLASHDGKVFLPFNRLAEQFILSQPISMLKAYRAEFDAIAQGMLNRSMLNSISELKTAAERYFLTSYGDEAAYRLACIYIDREDFGPAINLLNRLVNVYPDTTVDRFDIQIRLAAAYGLSGCGEKALYIIEHLEGLSSERQKALLKHIQNELQKVDTFGEEAKEMANQWNMEFGNRSRNALMDGIAAESRSGKKMLNEIWGKQLELDTSFLSNSNRRRITIINGKRVIEENKTVNKKLDPKAIHNSWYKLKMLPTEQLIYRNGLVVVNSHPYLLCYNISNGNLIWKQGDAKKTLVRFGYNYGMTYFGKKMSKSDIWLFGNRLNRAISICGNTVYRTDGNNDLIRNRMQRVFLSRNKLGQSQNNYLCAHDLKTGREKWVLGNDQEEGDDFFNKIFLSPPVECAGNLIVPVESKDGLYAFAIDPQTGNTVWKRFLCSYQPENSMPWSPTNMLVDGNDIYFATARGLLLCLDAVDVSVKWASTYKRLPPRYSDYWIRNFRRWQESQKISEAPDGWDGNHILSTSGSILLLPADSPNILCFDKHTGAIKYTIPKKDRDYALGITENSLFIAGRKIVTKIDTGTGKEIWNAETPASMGRGFLTKKSVFIPLEDSIIELANEDGATLSDTKVATKGDFPLGSIYSCGDMVLFVGGNKLGCLRDASALIANLNQKVESDKSASAYLERGMAYVNFSNFEKAREDLVKALELAENDKKFAVYADTEKRLKEMEESREESGEILGIKSEPVATYNFKEGQLEPDWKAIRGKAEVIDGAMKTDGKASQFIELNKKLPESFRFEYTAWQNSAPLGDLSSVIKIKRKNGKQESISVLFGANLNIRNMIQLNNRKLVESKTKLISLGKKHKVAVIKIKDRIVLYVDDELVLDLTHEGFNTKDDETKINLYGWNNEHFFTDIKLDKISDENVSKLQKKSKEIRAAKDSLRKQLAKFKRKNVTTISYIKEKLAEALLAIATRKPEQADALFTEAGKLVTHPKLTSKIAIARAESLLNNKRYGQCVHHCLSFFGKNACDNEYVEEYSERQFTSSLRNKLNIILLKTCKASTEAREIAENYVRSSAKKLLQKNDGDGLEHYRFMRNHKFASYAFDVGLKAAKIMSENGDDMRAELALKSISGCGFKPKEAQAQVELYQLYQKREWNDLAKTTLSKLTEVFGETTITVDNMSIAARAFAQKELATLKKTIHENSVQQSKIIPPYEILWKSENRQVMPLQLTFEYFQITGKFFENNLLTFNRSKKSVDMLNASTGKSIWKEPIVFDGFVHLYNIKAICHAVVFNQYQSNTRTAVDIVNGKTLWSKKTGESAGQIRINNFKANFINCNNNVITIESGENGTIMKMTDVVDGVGIWEKTYYNTPNIFPFAFGRYLIIANGEEQTAPSTNSAEIIDSTTGATVSRIKINSLRCAITTEGLITRDKGTYSLIEIPSGKTLWTRPTQGDNARMGQISEADMLLHAHDNGLTVVDIKTGKNILTANTGQKNTNGYSFESYYNKSMDAIDVLLDRSRFLRIGLKEKTITADWNQEQGLYPFDIDTNDDYMIYRRNHFDVKTKHHNRELVFKNKVDGKSLRDGFSDIFQKVLKDKAGKFIYMSQQPIVKGDVIIIGSRGYMIAIRHDGKAPPAQNVSLDEIIIEENKAKQKALAEQQKKRKEMRKKMLEKQKATIQKNELKGGSSDKKEE